MQLDLPLTPQAEGGSLDHDLLALGQGLVDPRRQHELDPPQITVSQEVQLLDEQGRIGRLETHHLNGALLLEAVGGRLGLGEVHRAP